MNTKKTVEHCEVCKNKNGGASCSCGKTHPLNDKGEMITSDGVCNSCGRVHEIDPITGKLNTRNCWY
ncbi:MAG: hypothetical protein UU13_C0004G0018 [Candidatus Nomurabacteria bacterium GW2011_GWB1_40_7]|uniref:Uncharacterized protein n=1 Tax=Candidatus Nomurabacteria bacterium GW2011_GWB1_40_7 TaxID=1618744 RepID=A0A0G0W5H1_9BACT|nr:MAG: hypothetical protein UU13_C0004G0018 [Candidatus Nomurabacteria bacterium GW2011_GWB1_40_7]